MDSTAHAAHLRKLIHSAQWHAVNALIRDCPDPSLYTSRLPCGHTPLQLASLLGAPDVVTALLHLGISPADAPAQIFAARNGHADVLRALLPSPAPCASPATCVCAHRVPAPGPALHAAAWHAHTAAAQVILASLCPFARRAALFWKAHNGGTALHAAALSGDSRLVELLLTSGAAVWARDANGMRPIDWARRFVVASSRGKEVVALLVSAQMATRRDAGEKPGGSIKNISQDETVDIADLSLSDGSDRETGKLAAEDRMQIACRADEDDMRLGERAPCVPRAVRPVARKTSTPPPCRAA